MWLIDRCSRRKGPPLPKTGLSSLSPVTTCGEGDRPAPAGRAAESPPESRGPAEAHARAALAPLVPAWAVPARCPARGIPDLCALRTPCQGPVSASPAPPRLRRHCWPHGRHPFLPPSPLSSLEARGTTPGPPGSPHSRVGASSIGAFALKATPSLKAIWDGLLGLALSGKSCISERWSDTGITVVSSTH